MSELRGALNDVREIDGGPRRSGFIFGQLQEILHDLSNAEGRARRLLERFTVCFVELLVHEHELYVAKRAGEWIVDLVGYTGAQDSQAGESS